MTTALNTVNSETNGTLKPNTKKFTEKLMHMLASTIIAFSVLTIMSFSQDDTSRIAEDLTTKTSIQVSTDSCCAVTYIQGIHQVVITNRTALTSEIRINNMDIQSWLNSLKAYSFKRFTLHSVTFADQQMDVSFTTAEELNNMLAAGFTKKVFASAITADEELSDLFLKNVASVYFSKSINIELQNADIQTDQQFMNETEQNALAAQFKKSLAGEKEKADDAMDRMIRLSSLKNFTPVTSIFEDIEMDFLLLNEKRKNELPISASEADTQMDELFFTLN